MVDDLGEEFALLWRNDSGTVFADLIVTAGRTAPLWTPRTTARPRALLRAGRAVHGEAFMGVRVVSLAAPARSMLVTDPAAPPVALVDSELWFGPPPLSAEMLAELTEAAR